MTTTQEYFDADINYEQFKVYLCGGINGLSDSQCKDWRELSKTLLKGPTIDPMRRDYRGVEDQNVNNIIENDILDILDSSAILVNATAPSWGTAMEIIIAYNNEKPVIAFVNPGTCISPWLRFHCENIVTSIEEACKILNDYAAERPFDPTRDL